MIAPGSLHLKCMGKIHLIGSEGFIGRAIQRQAGLSQLHLWSHSADKADHYFNLLESRSWEALLSQKPESVIILSWPGLPNYDKSYHVTVNMPATINLTEKLIEAGTRHVIFAGTCYEYGLQNGMLGEDTPADPYNLYAIAKDAARRSVARICDQAKVRWCWLRIFYLYGIGQNELSFMPQLDRMIQNNENSFPMSSGIQIRDYVSVETIADQMITLATDLRARGIYNGASGKPSSLREIAERRISESGSQIKLKLGAIPDRSDEPLAFWADMRRLQKLQTSVR